MACWKAGFKSPSHCRIPEYLNEVVAAHDLRVQCHRFRHCCHHRHWHRSQPPCGSRLEPWMPAATGPVSLPSIAQARATMRSGPVRCLTAAQRHQFGGDRQFIQIDKGQPRPAEADERGIMGQVLHRSATTTEAIRQAIQHSQESMRSEARRHGINPNTVAKWKKRESTVDRRTGPTVPRSTVLTV